MFAAARVRVLALDAVHVLVGKLVVRSPITTTAVPVAVGKAARVAKVAAAKLAILRVTKAVARLTKVMQARVTKAAARTASKAATTALIPPCASWKICHMCLPSTIPIGFDCC